MEYLTKALNWIHTKFWMLVGGVALIALEIFCLVFIITSGAWLPLGLLAIVAYSIYKVADKTGDLKEEEETDVR